MWHRFNPNPRGSSVGDCVVRAVAAATGQSWEQAYIALALTGYTSAHLGNASPARPVSRNMLVGTLAMGVTFLVGTAFAG